MKVYPTHVTSIGVPNYYNLYVKWLKRAILSKDNSATYLTEAYRLARVAEEFGQAFIEEDITQDDLLNCRLEH